MSDLKKFAFKIGIKKGLQNLEIRGTNDPDTILQVMQADWDALQAELGKFGAAELDQLKNHFNELIPNQDGLGEALCGDVDDFRLALSDLDQESKKLLTDELIRVEIFDPDN